MRGLNTGLMVLQFILGEFRSYYYTTGGNDEFVISGFDCRTGRGKS